MCFCVCLCLFVCVSFVSRRKLQIQLKHRLFQRVICLLLVSRGLFFWVPHPVSLSPVWFLLSLPFALVIRNKNRRISWQPQQQHFPITWLLGEEGSNYTWENTCSAILRNQWAVVETSSPRPYSAIPAFFRRSRNTHSLIMHPIDWQKYFTTYLN